MEFRCQAEAITQLKLLSESNRHSVLLEGPPGCGKTYLAKQYAIMCNITDISIVTPKVSEIKTAIEGSLSVENTVLLCIENLDLGVSAASYALLKFLEEPLPNVYIVVTCRNAKFVPDTIISRSTVVNVNPPTTGDIIEYSKKTNEAAYEKVKNMFVWSCVRTLNDADAVLKMTSDELIFYQNLGQVCRFNDSVSNTVWAISHYTHNNTECNLELSIRSIVAICNNPAVTQYGVQCIRELNQGRIAKHAILSKFIFNAKYTE